MRRTALLLLALSSSTLLAACGGGGGSIVKSDAPPVSIDSPDGGDPTADDPMADDPSTDGGTTDGGTTDGGASGGLGGGSGTGTDLDKCIELSEAFTKIAQEAPTMDETTAQQTVDEMTSLFPDELQDDFTTLIEGYASSDPSAFNSDEFTKANEALTNYLTDLCTP